MVKKRLATTICSHIRATTDMMAAMVLRHVTSHGKERLALSAVSERWRIFTGFNAGPERVHDDFGTFGNLPKLHTSIPSRPITNGLANNTPSPRLNSQVTSHNSTHTDIVINGFRGTLYAVRSNASLLNDMSRRMKQECEKWLINSYSGCLPQCVET